MVETLGEVAGEASSLAVLLGLGLVLYLAVLIFGTAWRLTRPPRRTYAHAVARNLPGDPSELDTPMVFEEQRVRVAWGRGSREVGVWRITGNDPGGPVAVLTPGWGDSRVGSLVRLAPFVARCSEIICWDPPGHGDSGGACSLGVREAGALRDLIAKLDPAGPIVLVGWSLGAGVSIAAAAGGDAPLRSRIGGVIAEAPYRVPATPARNVLRGAHMPWRVNLPAALGLIGAVSGGGVRFDGFDRAGLAARLGEIPLLVVHGTADLVCPVADGRAIAGAADRATLAEIEGGGHNDLWTNREHHARCAEAVERFLRDAPTTIRA